jgi:hypothetical protein
MAISRKLAGDYLEAWRSIMNEDIWRFNQVSGAGIPDIAEGVYIQSEREYIANALNIAKNTMVNWLGYNLRPEYTHRELVKIPATGSLRNMVFQTKKRRLQSIGVRTTSLIEADRRVVYAAFGSTGIPDVATMTISLSVSPDEVGLFFRVDDGATDAGNILYQVLPLDITSDGSTLKIIGHRSLFVLPANIWQRPYENDRNLERRVGNTKDLRDFVQFVDVYRVYPDSTQAVVLQYDNGNGCQPTERYAEAEIIDSDLGYWRIRNTRYGVPSRMYISYLSGESMENGRMQSDLATAMTRFANVEMPYRPLNLFDRGGMFERDNEVESIAQNLQANPFGVYKGHYAAWKVVQARRSYA